MSPIASLTPAVYSSKALIHLSAPSVSAGIQFISPVKSMKVHGTYLSPVLPLAISGAIISPCPAASSLPAVSVYTGYCANPSSSSASSSSDELGWPLVTTTFRDRKALQRGLVFALPLTAIFTSYVFGQQCLSFFCSSSLSLYSHNCLSLICRCFISSSISLRPRSIFSFRSCSVLSKSLVKSHSSAISSSGLVPLDS